MGYLTSMTGEIEISPPLRLEEVDRPDLEFYGPNDNGPIAMLHEGEDIVWAIAPFDSDSVKTCYVEEQLQRLVDKYGKGRTFSGYIYGEGEDAGDMWRLMVQDGRAVKVKPRIVWPE